MFFHAFLKSRNTPCFWITVSKHGNPFWHFLNEDFNLSFLDINECSQLTFCGNNSSCVNTPGSYSCVCKGGYIKIGSKCEGMSAYTDFTSTSGFSMLKSENLAFIRSNLPMGICPIRSIFFGPPQDGEYLPWGPENYSCSHNIMIQRVLPPKILVRILLELGLGLGFGLL